MARNTAPNNATRQQPLAEDRPSSLNEKLRQPMKCLWLISQRPRPTTSNHRTEFGLPESEMTPRLHRRIANRLPFWTGVGNLGGETQTLQALP
jgi:hypothetical protein